MKRLSLKIYGQVQGIFFRVGTYNKAKELGLSGWVKNVSGGAVEILAEGKKEALEELKNWCQTGLKLAQVERVEEEWEDIEDLGFSEFKIVY